MMTMQMTLGTERGTVTPTYIQILLAAITHDKAFKSDDSSSVTRHSLPTTRHASLIEPLTPREQEVLTLRPLEPQTKLLPTN